MPKYTKTGITQPSDGLYTCARLHLMQNLQRNTSDDFLYIHAHVLGVFGPNFPDLPQYPKYTKTDDPNTLKQMNPQMVFTLEFGV